MARYGSVLDLVGDTPMVDVSALSPTESVRIWLKLEGKNPAGSVKDGDEVSILPAVAGG